MTTDTAPSTLLPEALHALHERLCGGVLSNARRLSPTGPSTLDRIWKELTPHLEGLWASVPVSPGPLPEADSVEEAIERFSKHLAARDERVRRQLRFLVLCPHEILTRSLGSGTGHTSPASDEAALRVHWVRACVTVEAVWRCVDSAADAYGELARLRPLAARNRFLVLAEPMRYRTDLTSPWVPGRASVSRGTGDPTKHVFGTNTRQLLVDRARAARRDWYAYLSAYQSHPLLAQAEFRRIEDELRELCTARGYCTGPLVLSPLSLDKDARPDGEDEDVAWEVLQNHLLPRFRFLEAAPLTARTTARRCYVYSVSVLACGCVLGAVVAALFFGSYQFAAIPAALCYASIGFGTAVFGRAWAALWLLRLPAAATLGMVPLIAFPDWWQRIRFDWQIGPMELAPLLLLGVSYGYLVIEARNHDVGRWRAFGRAAAVTAVGALHAFLVALLGLTVIAPVFGEKTSNTTIASLWTASDNAPVAALVTAAALCLAIGVFSQILWDERPITAPLAHTHWRGKH